MKQIFEKITGKPIIILLGVLIVVTTVVQLVLSNQLAVSTGTLSQILAEVEGLERGNRDLAVQVYERGSILRVKELATEFGFTEPKKFFFVKQNFLVAESLR